MTGTLVPSWWKRYEVSPSEIAVVSIVWGITLGWAMFASGTAIKQTLHTRRRTKRISSYVFMIWAELIASVIISFISWFYMMSYIPPSFEFYFFVLVLWVIQIQVILQIIVNRVGLLVPDKRRVRNMKWVVGLYVGIINVSVFCIWMPAQLQRSETYVHVNHIWDRVEKVLFLLIDAALNFYFLHMVRRDLIANGLHKYTTLFHTNVAMAIVSIFMDIAIILSMFFKNPFVYVQFHPLAYVLKLSIEMSLADLIAKVVRASHGMNCDDDPSGNFYSTGTGYPTGVGGGTDVINIGRLRTDHAKSKARTIDDLGATTGSSSGEDAVDVASGVEEEGGQRGAEQPKNGKEGKATGSEVASVRHSDKNYQAEDSSHLVRD